MLRAHPGEGRRLTRRVWLLASVALIAFGACGPGEDLTLDAPAPRTPGQAVGLADGRHFGYIDDVDLSAHALTFDVAEFLEGDAADRAAVRAGELEPGGQVENDYYIVNEDEASQRIAFSEDVKIRVVGDPPDTIPGELEPFAAGFETDNVEYGTDDPYRGKNTQYWVTIRDGVVVEIEELYLP